MKRIRIALGLSLSLALLFAWTGCRSWPRQTLDSDGEDLTVGRVQREITVGMDAASVAEILGSPNIVTTDAERREVWVYDKVSSDRVDTSRRDHATLIIIGTRSKGSSSSTRQRTLTIIIKFDEQDLVRDFAYNYTQF
jgi:outer membrane protein assembly factor BamE (lipoprotein component of BamABCDE complex)